MSLHPFLRSPRYCRPDESVNRHCPYGWEGKAEEDEGEPGDRPEAHADDVPRGEVRPVRALLTPSMAPLRSQPTPDTHRHTNERTAGAKEKHLKNTLYKSSWGLFLATAIGLPGIAEAESTLSPVVVTAGRIAEDPARISADVSVIDRAAIERSQQQTAADLLRSVPGVDVAATGGPGKTTSVFLRGANSGQTLVLIDGIRVGSATLGQFDWAHLSTSDIERIEIARGAQSSL